MSRPVGSVGRYALNRIVTACAVRVFCKTSRPLGLRRLSPFCAFPAPHYNDKRAVIVPRSSLPCAVAFRLAPSRGLGGLEHLPPDNSVIVSVATIPSGVIFCSGYSDLQFYSVCAYTRLEPFSLVRFVPLLFLSQATEQQKNAAIWFQIVAVNSDSVLTLSIFL